MNLNLFNKYKTQIFVFAFCCILLFLILYLTFIRFINSVKEPLSNLTNEVRIIIPQGSNARKIALLFEDSDFPFKKNLFLRWVRFKGLDGQLKSGEYIFNKDMSINDITSILVEGRSILHRIVVQEGMSLNEIIDMLENRLLIDRDEFLNLVNSKEIIEEMIPFEVNSFEGFFFPDTYEIPKKFGEINIIKMFVNRFLNVNKDLIELNEYPLGLNFYEILILASIVEKEAVKNFERSRIAGVYYNRLKSGMRLEADPTVIYSLGENRKRVLFKDLRVDSLYNTYLYHGLPPTPICSPGYNSIKAAVLPEEHDYLFFIAKRDGTHHFSKTFREHTNMRRRLRSAN